MNLFSKLCISALVVLSINSHTMERDEADCRAEELTTEVSNTAQDIANTTARFRAQQQKMTQLKETGFLSPQEIKRIADLELKIGHYLKQARSLHKRAENILKTPLETAAHANQKAKVDHANALVLMSQYSLQAKL